MVKNMQDQSTNVESTLNVDLVDTSALSKEMAALATAAGVSQEVVNFMANKPDGVQLNVDLEDAANPFTDLGEALEHCRGEQAIDREFITPETVPDPIGLDIKVVEHDEGEFLATSDSETYPSMSYIAHSPKAAISGLMTTIMMSGVLTDEGIEPTLSPIVLHGYLETLIALGDGRPITGIILTTVSDGVPRSIHHTLDSLTATATQVRV